MTNEDKNGYRRPRAVSVDCYVRRNDDNKTEYENDTERYNFTFYSFTFTLKVFGSRKKKFIKQRSWKKL